MNENKNGFDCPICLQTLLQPTQLPCGHIFCYLCLKGSAFHKRKCPLCRSAIRMNFFENPTLVDSPGNADLASADSQTSTFVWYYEGRNGWWQYDERTAAEIESAFMKSLTHCEVFVAGHFYIINFNEMCQHRKDSSGRVRQIKRDAENFVKKGVAGIRMSILAKKGIKSVNVACTNPNTEPTTEIASNLTAVCGNLPYALRSQTLTSVLPASSKRSAPAKSNSNAFVSLSSTSDNVLVTSHTLPKTTRSSLGATANPSYALRSRLSTSNPHPKSRRSRTISCCFSTNRI